MPGMKVKALRWRVYVGDDDVPEEHDGPLSNVLRDLADRFNGQDDEAEDIRIEAVE